MRCTRRLRYARIEPCVRERIPMDWLLLLHHTSGRPAYRRVKLWRRLLATGAVALRGGAYVLPLRESCRQGFEAIALDIVADGGQALLATASILAGTNDSEIVAAFQSARDRDYADLAAALPGLRVGARPTPERRAEIAAALGRARRRWKEVQAIDFFAAQGAASAQSAISALEHALLPGRSTAARPFPPDELRGRVWVTRRNIGIDRMACIWLIRRFLDPGARVRLVAGLSARRRRNELRFDMAEAEFTHEGDRCSFEVLLARSGHSDRALDAVGDLVHDLDLGDGKFGRPETAGLRRLVDGIVARHEGDAERIARSSQVLDDLYASFRRPVRARRSSTHRPTESPRARRKA